MIKQMRVVKMSQVHTQDDKYNNVILQSKESEIEIRINIKTWNDSLFQTFVGDIIEIEFKNDQTTLEVEK